MKIKVIDGIPCIELEDNILCTHEELKKKTKKLTIPSYFTEFQQSKEKTYYHKVLEELKKKFREI
ncbi:MAG: hypothetical protein ACXABO_07185 [Promethearchaeota archaeon]|jgi:hypothetical protein